MKVKQILAVILVVVFAMLALPVSAAEPVDTAISERRVELCGNCGGRMVTSTTWGSWYTVAQIKCTHHNYGTDLRQRETVRQQQSARAADRVTPLPNLRQELFATVTIPN